LGSRRVFSEGARLLGRRFFSSPASANSGGASRMWLYSLAGFSGLAGVGYFATRKETANAQSRPDPVNHIDNATVSLSDIDKQQFSAIIAGAGTAGCTTAYFLSKWMEELNVPGNVLLLDRGVPYTHEEGPDPRIRSWWHNWGSFGTAHDSFEKDGRAHPVPGSDHVGVGGCGTHDTRITFRPSVMQTERMAQMMGWSVEKLETFIQTALDTVPIVRADGHEMKGETFFNKLMQALAESDDAIRLPGDEFHTHTVPHSIAYCSVSMYNDESRWTPAYLVEHTGRPKKLRVASEAQVERVLFDEDKKKATGVIVHQRGDVKPVRLDEKIGEVAVTAGALGAPSILQRSGVGPKSVSEKLGVPVVVDNPEVGHGVDHNEICVQYEWDDRNLDENGEMPRSGCMDWALVSFYTARGRGADNQLDPPPVEEIGKTRAGDFVLAHWGIAAPPYTDGTAIVATPNCTQPAAETAGYRLYVKSNDPKEGATLIHEDQTEMLKMLAAACRRTITMFETLKEKGLVGDRISPPPSLPLDDDHLCPFIREEMGTAFHWMSTCKAGKEGAVADEEFRVRKGLNSEEVVRNLRVGSGASLPEITEANPHLTITSFAVALAYDMLKEQCARAGVPFQDPEDIVRARKEVQRLGHAVIRRPGEEKPNLVDLASQHRREYEDREAEKEREFEEQVENMSKKATAA